MECHGESRFRCEQCGDKFFRAESLRSHLKKIHDQVIFSSYNYLLKCFKEETFQCTYCGKWFLNHETLKSHSKHEHKVTYLTVYEIIIINVSRLPPQGSQPVNYVESMSCPLASKNTSKKSTLRIWRFVKINCFPPYIYIAD